MSEARLQRRLAAILAADVTGYSRLMEADEEGTLAALTGHFGALFDPLTARYGGHLVKTTGDGRLIEFPSVVDALACALAIQRGMAERNRGVAAALRIDFRIGINIGDVIVQDGDVFGDGVNVAARLQEQAQPGGVCLSEDAYRQVRGKLAFSAADGGERQLKNIARPIRVYLAAADEPGAAPAPQRAGRRRWPVAAVASAAAVAGVALAALLWVAFDRLSAPLTEADAAPPIIAVLPFENQTGDEAQGYLADGMTEDLIDALSRFRTLRVIARNAVLPYRDRPAAPQAVAAELGAGYLVRGSVRRAEDGFRIAAEVAEALTSTVLWSDRYHGAPAEFFRLQDTIARDIAGTLAARIDRIEARRSLERPTPQRDAYDLILRARAVGFTVSRAANRRFRELMAQAIEIDPAYGKSYALLAEAIFVQAIQGWAEFAERELADGERLARQAVALAPTEADGYRALGRYLVLRQEYEEAKHQLERAIEINPSDAHALAVWGAVQAFDGDIAGAVRSLELALKYDPMLEAIYVFDLALAYHLAGQHQQAIRTAETGLARFPGFPILNVPAAAAAARLGRADAAARHVAEIRRELPFLDLDALGSRYRNPAYPAYLREGLQLAGL